MTAFAHTREAVGNSSRERRPKLGLCHRGRRIERSAPRTLPIPVRVAAGAVLSRLRKPARRQSGQRWAATAGRPLVFGSAFLSCSRNVLGARFAYVELLGTLHNNRQCLFAFCSLNIKIRTVRQRRLSSPSQSATTPACTLFAHCFAPDILPAVQSYRILEPAILH
jgi:hypothetical protein